MPKKRRKSTGGPRQSRGTIIGAVGGTLIGAAILLFVCSMILTNLKATADPGGSGSTRSDAWNDTNDTIDTISNILTVCVILLAVLGIVLIGSQMIALIGGGFGG